MNIKILRETHDCPQNIQALLLRLSGSNPFGEPVIRAIWGWNRLTTICGKWTLADIHGNVTGEHEEWARVPLYTAPYFNPNRWYFERWKSAAEFFGSPEQWEKTNDGNPNMPYDSRGEYDHQFTLANPSGEFVQITETIAAEVVRRFHRKRNETKDEKFALNVETLDTKEKAADSWDDSVLSDTNKFQGKIHVYQ